jgi:hypothetical protein
MKSTKALNMDKTRPKKPEYKPAARTEDILEKQRVNLAKTIKALSHAEEKRASRLDRTESRAAREKLEARFDKERESDQKRVMVIKDDFESLKKSIAEGKLNESKVQQRYAQQMADRKLPSRIESSHNRFLGLETPTDVILFKANVHMFEKYDSKFRQRAQMERHMAAEEEQFKLGLLRERRDVLKQLIHVQQKEMKEVHNMPQSSARVSSARSATNRSSTTNFLLQAKMHTPAPASARRPSSTASTASAASAASWASFGSSTGPKYGVAKNASLRPKVPTLNLKR